MGDMEKLTESLEKLRKNKENVPLEILETRYKDGYGKLKSQIKELLQNVVTPTAAQTPEWMAGRHVYKKEYADEMIKIFREVYAAGNYARRLGDAAYKHYSIPEVLSLAREINAEYDRRLLQFFHTRTCLYVTEECCRRDDPQIPGIYNDFVEKFYDEQQQKWTESEPDNQKQAILS
ncbi:MAG: hypothetical protein PHV18_04395 [Lachnospiraceae bacterium]|nr:hypothetical protein [Lachnospiraceae bacterium]